MIQEEKRYIAYETKTGSTQHAPVKCNDFMENDNHGSIMSALTDHNKKILLLGGKLRDLIEVLEPVLDNNPNDAVSEFDSQTGETLCEIEQKILDSDRLLSDVISTINILGMRIRV